ncbi:MAG: F0F1 ATP synthase subunit epsilon [Pseudomonadota bacterium]
MPEKLQFDLVAPERAIASVEADIVEAPGVEGMIGVLPGHAPFMTVLAPGCVTYTIDGAQTRIFVRGGFAEVTPAGLTILAEEAVPVAELDRSEIERRIKDCEEDLADADTTPETRLRAEREVVELREVLAAL